MLKPFNSSTTISVEPYCSNAPAIPVDVVGRQVGDLLVHRSVCYFVGEEGPRLSRRYWQITHVPTGLKIEKGLPAALIYSPRRRDLLAFAEAFQDRIPQFFSAAKSGRPDEELCREAIDAGFAVARELGF